MQYPLNKVRHTTIAIAVGSDRIIKMLLGEEIQPDATILSIRTRRAGANRKTKGGKTIVNDVNFDSALLTLKKKNEQVLKEVPLELIEKATNITPEQGFPIMLSNVDWNTSYIEVGEGVALNTGNYFELTVTFTLPV